MHLVCQGYEGYHTFLKGRVTDVSLRRDIGGQLDMVGAKAILQFYLNFPKHRQTLDFNGTFK